MGVIRVYAPHKIVRGWNGEIIPSGRFVYITCEPRLYKMLMALWDKYGVLESDIPAILHKREST